MTRLTLACALTLVAATAACAACLDGDYVVVGAPLLSSPHGAFDADVVTIAGRTVALASGCPAVPARIQTTERGTRLRAVWNECGAARRVRLVVTINKPCRTMRGLLRVGRPRIARRFVARHDGGCPADAPRCVPCRTNDACGDGAFCARTYGQCDGPGACEDRPARCPFYFVAVCGCDGVTYPGPCQAAQHGVSVAHPGKCDETCGAGSACAAGDYCARAAGDCDGEGTCKPRPEACIQLYAPVCGCDGTTYGNTCAAATAGVGVAHDGPCAGVPCTELCDCYRNATFEHACPLLCPNCDNYWTCEKGTCAAHCGPLPAPPPTCEPTVCGGIAGLPCPDGLSCDLPAGECHSADLQGICVETPDVCPATDDPVCACDGTTYANDCARRTKGTQKAHDGPCE